jgi:glyceraldehyde 3-phosphate dehydrogenase
MAGLAQRPDLAHLLEFDSSYGRTDASVTDTADSIIVGGRPIRVSSSYDPADID